MQQLMKKKGIAKALNWYFRSSGKNTKRSVIVSGIHLGHVDMERISKIPFIRQEKMWTGVIRRKM